MMEKTKFKAELKIILQAGDTVVAESCDSVLWQKVLAALNMPVDSSGAVNLSSKDVGLGGIEPEDEGAIGKLAKELSVSITALKGACNPSKKSPFIHLDRHHWEAFKKGTPKRGPKSISAVVLASTLLILWKEKDKLGGVTVKEAQKVLSTIGLRDTHPHRALKSCEWLQMHGDNIIINPAETSKAIAWAKAYCTKEYGK